MLIGQAGAVVGALVGVRMLTSLLSPESYGEVALAMTALTLAQQIAFGPIANAVNRLHSAANEQRELSAFLCAVKVILVRASSGAVVVLAIASAFYAWQSHGGSLWLNLFTCLFVLSAGTNGVLNSLQTAQRLRVRVALFQSIDSWGRYCLAAVVVLFGERSSSAAMLGFVTAACAVTAAQYHFIPRPKPSSTPATAESIAVWVRKLNDFAKPFALWGTFTWLQLVSDRWALEVYSTTRNVGLYSALFQLGYYPISLATVAGMQFFGPIIFERVGAGDDADRTQYAHRATTRLAISTLGLTLAATVVSGLLHATIFSVLVGREYRDVSYLLPWMVLSGGLFSCGQVLSLRVMADLRPHDMVWVKIGTACLGVALNVFGARTAGVLGVVAASVVFSGLYLCWIWKIASHRRKG